MPTSTCSHASANRCSCQPRSRPIISRPVNVTRFRQNEACPGWPSHIGSRGYAGSLADIESRAAIAQTGNFKTSMQPKPDAKKPEDTKTKSTHHLLDFKTKEQAKFKNILTSPLLNRPLHASSYGSWTRANIWTRRGNVLLGQGDADPRSSGEHEERRAREIEIVDGSWEVLKDLEKLDQTRLRGWDNLSTAMTVMDGDKDDDEDELGYSNEC